MLLEDENLYVSQNRASSNGWQRELGNPVDQNVTVASIMMGYLNCRSSGKQCPADILAYWKRDTGLIIERKRNRMEVDQSELKSFSVDALKPYRFSGINEINRDRLLLVLSRNVEGKTEIVVQTIDIPEEKVGNSVNILLEDSFRDALDEGDTLLRVDIPGPRAVGMVLLNASKQLRYRTFVAESNGRWPNEIALDWRRVPVDIDGRIDQLTSHYIKIENLPQRAYEIPVSWSGDGSYIAVSNKNSNTIVYKLDSRCKSIDAATLRLTIKTGKYTTRDTSFTVSSGDKTFYDCDACLAVSLRGYSHSLLVDEVCIPRKGKDGLAVALACWRLSSLTMMRSGLLTSDQMHQSILRPSDS